MSRDFWSRRKAGVAAEAEAEGRAVERELDALREAETAEVDDETLLQMLGLPDPETLTPADAARFMAREVPSRLRKRAMRALFRGHPGISAPDGLLDYNEDYTVAAPDVRPAPVKWESIRRAVEEVVEAAPEAEAPVETFAEVAMVEEAPEPEIEEEVPVRPRRMVFHVEGEA